jgi:hypothetical protein
MEYLEFIENGDIYCYRLQKICEIPKLDTITGSSCGICDEIQSGNITITVLKDEL